MSLLTLSCWAGTSAAFLNDWPVAGCACFACALVLSVADMMRRDDVECEINDR